MESVIECIVCLEHYNSFEKLPLILTCGHTLCKECILRMNSGCLSIKCPIDRKIETKNSKQLTVNYAILQILNLHRSGIPSRENCIIHSQPITMICKTCSSNCCYKCIRSHSGHDVYDADHPVILNEIENNIKKVGNKIEDGLDTAVRSCERIKKELRELNSCRNKLKSEINTTYDYFIKQVEAKRKESLEMLENKFRDKEEFLNSCFSEAEVHVKHYENYDKDMDIIRKQSKDKKFVDRAVTSSNMLKKMLLIQYPTVRDINNCNLRLGLDTFSISAFQIPTIKVVDFSPAEVLEKTYFLELEELQNNYSIYQKLSPEQKLSFEISCSSLFIMTQSNSLNIAKLHLLNYCCWEILQQDYNNINENLRRNIFEKAGLPRSSLKLDYSSSIELLSKIRTVKAIIYSLQKLKEKQWEEALSTIHCVIMRENSYELAEEYLQVILLRICSYSFTLIKSYQVIDSLTIVQLLKNYLKFHFLPSNIIYKQIVTSLKHSYNYVKNSLSEFFFPFFQQRYTSYINELEQESSEMIIYEYPPELQYMFSLLTEDSVRFWKDKELAQNFVEKFQNFKEECSQWFQALALIRDRGDVLSEEEIIVLERS
ncbi:hypothetical protein SteCoe_29584 [Stentor coeruleus]|uniref:RING-type domain-containing protein n=1 Tax=Stentor coeruleus TaxID=5963 RepID=A0A1R2B5I3_9CILI|nr:hypothetical protein SteCoe_29584 [Stentor coeruleus]